MLDAAMERRSQYDFAGAIEHLDKLVAHAPDYAEGWNQRATILFLQEKYDRSLEDVATTGGQAVEAVETLRELGANVLGVISVIDREEPKYSRRRLAFIVIASVRVAR